MVKLNKNDIVFDPVLKTEPSKEIETVKQLQTERKLDQKALLEYLDKQVHISKTPVEPKIPS